MDGFGIICGVCKDNAKIQQNQSNMQHQLEISARQAQWAAEELSDQARAHHEEAMRAESDRLEELQKQTQILLEGQIANEDAYQQGLDLKAECINLLLTEDGRIYWEVFEPYFIARLNAAYEKGVQERLEKEFASNFPGLQYMKQEAFGHGYAGSRNCSIVYLHHLNHIYPAKLNILSDTGLAQTINQGTGKIERQWMPTYMSEELNDAYDAGVKKYLDEQNVSELVAERLEKNKVDLRLAEESALKMTVENELQEKNLEIEKRSTSLNWIFLTITSISITLIGLFLMKPR